MKQIIYILIVTVLASFNACFSDIKTQKVELVENNVPVTKPVKSDTTLTLVEAEESNYEFITTFTQKDLKKLIPNEYKNYNHIRISNVYDGVMYISTEKVNGNKTLTQDVFAYYPQDNTITHIVDVSKLKSWLCNIYVVDENFYFCTKTSSDEKLYLYCNDELTLLTDDFFGIIETSKGIAFTQVSTRSIIEFEGKNKTVITPELFPSILCKSDPLTYISCTNGKNLLCTIENNTLTRVLELPTSNIVAFNDYFWFDYGKEPETLCMYNYNNEELISFEDNQTYCFGGNEKDTIFRVDFDDNIWEYKYDAENKTITKAMLKDSKPLTLHIFVGNNYVIRCYYESYKSKVLTYDIYREK